MIFCLNKVSEEKSLLMEVMVEWTCQVDSMLYRQIYASSTYATNFEGFVLQIWFSITFGPQKVQYCIPLKDK